MTSGRRAGTALPWARPVNRWVRWCWADGAPLLGSRQDRRSWAEVLRIKFANLRAADETGIATLLDGYGATNPAEFFAVATEAFFERPHALR
ncbi:MAG: zinc-dependent peptidase [Chthoniobacterales bacterium]